MKHSLNYNWKFVSDFKQEYLNALPKEAEIINIPHTTKEVPYNYFDEKDYQKVVTYEKIFDLEEEKEGKKVLIKFDAFMLKADIYLNGSFLGKFISGYNPIEIDITEYVKYKGNRLLVVLDSHEDNEIPPFGFAVDYLTFGGIYREVSIEVLPENYLRNFFIKTKLNGKVEVEFDTFGKNLEVEHEVYLGNKLVLKTDKNIFKIEDPKLWNLDNPVLYSLVTCFDGYKYSNRFAFKESIFKQNGFYLNGNRTKLRGLNRHQSYPYIGYAATKSLQILDADILKYELGLNVVRTSHYPQSQHFLNRCDEIGLLVVNEIPGWQHIGSSEAWQHQFFENIKSMILEERNHPCIIAHGVRIDESVDNHDMYFKANKIAHDLDSVHQTIGVRNIKNSELLEDIYGYNDFVCNSLKIGLENPKKVRKNKSPYLVTEYMGHMDPFKATTDIEKRVEVSLRHAKVLDDALKYDEISGSIGWCFVDYYTHAAFGSGDRICAHGVLDMYRNPKYSAYIYASQQDEKPVLEVLSDMKPGDVPEAIYGPIYVATNCDYVDLYKNNEFVKRFYPKHDLFKFLKHPPILIDDVVGDTFKEDNFNPKDFRKMGEALSYSGFYGSAHLTLKYKLLLFRMCKKYHLSYNELVPYWIKYVGTWGGEPKLFRFVGYKENKEVVSQVIGPSNSFDLKVSTNKTELINEETYDMAMVSIKYVDQFDSLMLYANKPVKIDVSGPIEFVGDDIQNLIGGQLSIYVKSKQEKGQGTLRISLGELVKEAKFDVK